MSQTGDKYKLKITNIGIGDPFVFIATEFKDDGTPPGGGSWHAPSSDGLHDLNLKVYFSNDQKDLFSDDHHAGSVSVAELHTNGPYFFGVPFDQGDFAAGASLYLGLRASAGDGDTVYVCGDDDPNDSGTFQTLLTYGTPPDGLPTYDVYYYWAH